MGTRGRFKLRLKLLSVSCSRRAVWEPGPAESGEKELEPGVMFY